jgi:hypothetical protein
MLRLYRSRLVWLTLGVLTLAGVAFWLAVAVVAVVMTTAASGADPDPDALARAAVPAGLLPKARCGSPAGTCRAEPSCASPPRRVALKYGHG